MRLNAVWHPGKDEHARLLVRGDVGVRRAGWFALLPLDEGKAVCSAKRPVPVYARVGGSNANPGSAGAVGDRHRPAAIHERPGCVCPVSGTVPHCPELCDLVLSQGLGIAERAQPPADGLAVDAGGAGDARRVGPGAPLANDFFAETVAGLLGRGPRLMVGPGRLRKSTVIHPSGAIRSLPAPPGPPKRS